MVFYYVSLELWLALNINYRFDRSNLVQMEFLPKLSDSITKNEKLFQCSKLSENHHRVGGGRLYYMRLSYTERDGEPVPREAITPPGVKNILPPDKTHFHFLFITEQKISFTF